MVTAEELTTEWTDDGLGGPCIDCGESLICPTCNPQEMQAIDKDVRNLARSATTQVARYLVDNFYVAQHNRIRAQNQIRACAEDGESAELLRLNLKNFRYAENQIAKIMDEYSAAQELGQWARSIHGIGPVITAGLLAHIDLDIAKTPAAIWRFAGLDPTVKWEKGKKRPWNTTLKTLCFKIASSFEKVQNSDNDFYGHLMIERKNYETERNELGLYKEQADAKLATGSFKALTPARKAYESGKLPAGQIRARAFRWVEKLFLSHYFQVGYEIKHGKSPARPWVIAIGGHQDFIAPPNWEGPSQ